MRKNTLIPVLAGAVLLAVGMVLRKTAGAEGPQILLSLAAFVLVGLLAAGAKRGFLIGLLLGAVFTLVNGFVNKQLSFQSISVAAASIIVGVIVPSLLAGGIAAIFGLIGRALFRRK